MGHVGSKRPKLKSLCVKTVNISFFYWQSKEANIERVSSFGSWVRGLGSLAKQTQEVVVFSLVQKSEGRGPCRVFAQLSWALSLLSPAPGYPSRKERLGTLLNYDRK